MDIIKELDAYIRAKYPFIWIRSPEEQEVIASLAALAKSGERGCRLWSLISGFTEVDGTDRGGNSDPQQDLMSVSGTSGKSLFIFRDYHPFVEANNPANVAIIRTVREVGRELRAKPPADMKTVIFLSPLVKLPPELESEVVVLDWPRPDRDKLSAVLDEAMGHFKLNGDVDKEAIVSAALGLTVHEASNCLSRSMIKTKTLDPDLVKNEKKQIIERSGVLKWVDPVGSLNAIGGLDVLKDWLKLRRLGFTQAAKDYGLEEPKGMILLGPPGTGKSLCVKVAGTLWTMPVLQVHADKIKGQFVGESEQRLRKVLETAEVIAPSILFIDEIEKLVAGAAGSGVANGGVEANQLGMLLSWMQDKEKPVFVAATANSIETLPPELLRKGRFDELWFVDLPNAEERMAILDVHLRKRNRDPENFDLDKLKVKTEGFSGAELEAAIVTAMFAGFSQDREFNVEDIYEAADKTTPLSETKKDELDRFRKKAMTQCTLASTEIESGTVSQTFVDLDSM